MAPVRISFCRGCLSKWLETNAAKSCPLRCASRIERLVPNRFAACIIGALELRCPAAAEPDAPPCTWAGPLRELAEHRAATCVARPVRCPYAGCGAQVQAFKLRAHCAACGFEPVTCTVPGCGARPARHALDAHLKDAAMEHVQILTATVAELKARLAGKEAASSERASKRVRFVRLRDGSDE